MAKKMNNCSFCGKEITTGFLKGNEQILSPASDILISCCPDCYRQRKAQAEEVYDQLTAKVKSYMCKKNIVVVPKEQQRPIYEQYCQERAALQAGRGQIRTDVKGHFFRCNADGYFRWYEAAIGNDFNTRKSKVKTMKNTLDVNNDVYNKDDVGFIRYRVCSFDTLGLFSLCCTVEVCVNDIDTVSAKPQTTKFILTSKGLLWSLKKKCRREAREILEDFRDVIGSNLPVEEVKKFR